MHLIDYLQVSYRFEGRSWQGADCYGLLILYYRRECGIDLLDYKHGAADHTDPKIAQAFIENLHREFAPVDLAQAQAHDVLLICNASVRPNHCGVVIDRYCFLHTLHGSGPATSKIATWKKRIFGTYRHKELA